MSDNREQKLNSSLRGKLYRRAIVALLVLVAVGVMIYSASSAWYTNVAEIRGIVFETESWGFEGQVRVDEHPIAVAPGESGSVELSVTNDSKQVCEISVGVDKTAMSPQLQKRLYFYVPAASEENGETMERVYLSPYNQYTYRVMPKSTLLLTSETATDTPVHYEWCYDVLGYYVYGVVHNSDSGIYFLSENDLEAPCAYIRPVVYDYDAATFDSDGLLETVDGTTTVAEFLARLSLTDGYENDIDSSGGYGGYYPVSVRDEGNGRYVGLWVYLCTRNEIIAANHFDTRVGTYAYLQSLSEEYLSTLEEEEQERIAQQLESFADLDDLSYHVSLLLSGRNMRVERRDVGTAEELAARLEEITAGSYNELCLTSNVELEQTLSVPADTELVLNLGGNTISCATPGNPVLSVPSGGQLTVMGGTIDGENNTNAVYVTGGSASFSDVSVKGRIRVDDTDAANSADRTSVLRLANSEVVAAGSSQVAITLYGNGADNKQCTALIIENSTVSGGYFGICGNGSDSYYGTNIQIIGSTISGGWTSIYQPQRESTLVVSDSTLEGFTGLAVKGGTVTLHNSTVSGTAAVGADGLNISPTEEQLRRSASGFLDTGAGIYVEANYAWAKEIVLTVRNCTVSSVANPNAILVLGEWSEQVQQTVVNEE